MGRLGGIFVTVFERFVKCLFCLIEWKKGRYYYEKSRIGNQYCCTVDIGAESGVFFVVLLLQGEYFAEKILLKSW